MTRIADLKETPMLAVVERPPAPRTRSWPLRGIAVLVAGVALFGAVLTVLLDTGDPIYLPCLLLLGAAIMPAALTTSVTEINRSPGLSFARVVTAAVLGGVVGGVLAGQLEYDTARALGSLPYLMIGAIEESAKLAVPVLLLTRRRPSPRAVDGLVLGVAVGSGFAAMETMGYAFVALLHSGGHIQPVDSLLVLRAVGSLGGHAAWTGLACAAWYAIRGSRRRWIGWLRFLGTFVSVVCLHAEWDATAVGHGYLVVAAAGFFLLTATAWRLHRGLRREHPSTPPEVAGWSGRSASDSVPIQVSSNQPEVTALTH
jgi:protease PrsW